MLNLVHQYLNIDDKAARKIISITMAKEVVVIIHLIFWSQSARVDPHFVEHASIAKYVGSPFNAVPRVPAGLAIHNTYVEGLPDKK